MEGLVEVVEVVVVEVAGLSSRTISLPMKSAMSILPSASCLMTDETYSLNRVSLMNLRK